MNYMTKAEVLQNREIAPGIFHMALNAPEIARTFRSGQFLSLYTDDGAKLLPRPISICAGEEDVLWIVYQVLGGGTRLFSEKKEGESIRVLGPLGRGFDIMDVPAHVLIGGGVGVPPLLALARQIMSSGSYNTQGKEPQVTAFLGFRSHPFLQDEFEKAGVQTYVATEDGSCGFPGNVRNALEKASFPLGSVYACGPKPMLKAVYEWAAANGLSCQVSMEERMACGLGACVGCVVKISSPVGETGWEYQKVCKDGPVFDGSQVVWDE